MHSFREFHEWNSLKLCSPPPRRPRSSSQKTAFLSSFARDGITNPMHCIARHTTLYRPTHYTVSPNTLHCICISSTLRDRRPKKVLRKTLRPLPSYAASGAFGFERYSPPLRRVHPFRPNPAPLSRKPCRVRRGGL